MSSESAPRRWTYFSMQQHVRRLRLLTRVTFTYSCTQMSYWLILLAPIHHMRRYINDLGGEDKAEGPWKEQKGSPSSQCQCPADDALVLKDHVVALHLVVPLASHAHDLRCSVYEWQINDSPTTCLASCSKQSNISLSEGVACKTYVPNCEFWMCHASKHNFRLGRQRRKVTWIHVRSEVILLNRELLNHGRMSRWGQWVLPPEADGFNKYLQFASKKSTSCLAF